MVKAKKIVLCLLFLTTSLLNFREKEAFVPTTKRAETVQEERIDERLYRPYLNIQSEGVSSTGRLSTAVFCIR